MAKLHTVHSKKKRFRSFKPIKSLLKLSLATALGLGSFNAHAALEQVVYTDSQGEEITLTRPTKMFARANQNLQAVLSAGLDRRVEVSLYDALSDEKLSSSVSHLLTVDDKISFGEDQMYAVKMDVTTPSSEGSYYLVARTLGYGDVVLSEEFMDILIDSTPPTIGGTIYNSEPHENHGDITLSPVGPLSPGFTVIIAVDEVEDNIGITKATLNIYHDEATNRGELVTSQPASYDPVTKQITFNGHGKWSDLFKHHQGRYKLEFVAEDAAGNTSSVTHQIAFTPSCPAFKPEPVAVWTPGHTGSYLGQSVFKGYKEWKEGGVLPENPPRLVWRIPTSQMWPNNIYGYIETNTVRYRTASHVYFTSQVPFNNGLKGDSHQGGFSTRFHWMCYLFSEVKGSLAPGLTQTPKWVGAITRGLLPNPSTKSGTPLVTSIPHTRYATRITMEARPYEQTIELMSNGYSKTILNNNQCKIPANQTYCDLLFDRDLQPHNIYSAIAVVAYPTHNPSIRVRAGHSSVTTDFKPVEIKNLTYEKLTQKIQVAIFDPDSTEDSVTGTMWVPTDATLSFRNLDTNATIKSIISGVGNFERVNRNNFIAHFDLSGYPEGRYILESLTVTDVAGNAVTERPLPSNQPPTSPGQYIYVVDKTAPKIQPIFRTSEGSKRLGPNEVVSINSLDQLVFEVTDNSDVTINSISIQYHRRYNDPEKLDFRDGVYVGHRKEGDIVYLEYPLMNPTLEDNESYDIVINVVDEYGNESELRTTLKYEPQVIHLASGVNGKLYIPALMSEFYHIDGTRAISTEPLLLSDGSPLQGRYDVVVSLRDDSEIPLYVNNQLIVPSQQLTIIRNYDFSTNDSRLAIPVHAAENGLVGTAKLMMTTTAPNSPVLMIDVVTWNGHANLQSNTWEFRQVLDEFDITALPDENTICRVTSSEDEARAADPIKDPVCLLEWTQIPPESSPKTSDGGRGGGQTLAGLTGHAVALGEQTLRYELSIFNGLGDKMYLSDGGQKINIVPALGSIGFEPTHSSMEFDRSIEHIGIDFRQSFGPECKLTLDAQLATNSWGNRQSRQRYCLFEWLNLPPGVSQDERYNFPRSKGKVADLGEHSLQWRLSIYSILGAKVPVAEQKALMNIVDPQTPTFTIESQYQIKEGVNSFAVPMKGSTLGTLHANVGNGDIRVTSKLGNQVVDRRNFIAPTTGNSQRTTLRSSFQFLDSKLHDKKTYTAEVAYSDLPEINSTQDFVVYTVPQNTIRPEINVNREAVSTDLLPITINMNDSRFSRDGYSRERMGDWEARVVIPQGRNEPDRVLTDYMPMIDGLLTTEIDIEEFSQSRTLQLQAEARWVHNIPDYEHVVKSRALGRVSLLSGLPIDADLSARRISGEAPFTTIFSLSLNNANDRNNIETVEWQESSDGSNWQNIPMDFPDERRLTRTFNEGTHYVRAVITNKHSGFKSQTELIEVVAYQVVEAEIEGSLAHFVGSNANFKLNPFIRIEPTDEQKELIKRGQLDYESVSRKPIDLSKVEIEWTTDRWKTVAFEGDRVTLSSDDPSRFNLEARIKPIEAPEDDRQAFRNSKATVTFNNPRAPVIRISGNRRLELGVEHTFQIRLSAPFRNLSHDMAYEIVYPNGEIETAIVPASEGDIVNREFKYSLTEEDNRAGKVSFVVNAHIVGFEEETKTTALFSPQTWQYVFPNFFMKINRTTAEAPAEVNVSVSPSANFRGSLEDPTYEWKYPDNFEVVQYRNETSRKFQVNEAGEYEIEVTVRDARGNEKVVKGTVQLIEPKPFNVNLRTYPSNRYNREPLDVRLRAFISGGHPRDRLRNYNLEINGQESLPIGHLNVTGLNAGSNTIKLKGLSEMGVEVEESVQIDVNANKRPVCDPITGIRNNRAISVTAHCRDEDGQLVNHEWRINGQLSSVISRRITHRITPEEAAPTITLQVTDDSGAKSEVYSVTIK